MWHGARRVTHLPHTTRHPRPDTTHTYLSVPRLALDTSLRTWDRWHIGSLILNNCGLKQIILWCHFTYLCTVHLSHFIFKFSFILFPFYFHSLHPLFYILSVHLYSNYFLFLPNSLCFCFMVNSYFIAMLNILLVYCIYP